MMMGNRIICALLTVTYMVAVSNAQYYSRTYPYDEIRQTFITKDVMDSTGNLYIAEKVASADFLESFAISKVDNKGERVFLDKKNYMAGNPYMLCIRNDTIFYSGVNNSNINGYYNWYFGMMRTNGDSLAEYMFPVIPDTIPGVYVINYGLTLVGSRQVILWGEGRNPAEPDAASRPFQSVFMRVDFDGNLLSGPRFWQLHPERDRRMTDAVTDKEGNMVFGYAWWKEGQGYNRGIFRLDNTDSITQVAGEFFEYFNSFDNPALTMDHEGNFITILYRASIPITNTFAVDIPNVVKFDPNGNEIWRNYIRPNDFDKWDGSEYLFEGIKRMNVCRNNDILVCGNIFIVDSFPLPGTNTWVKSGAPSSFMARFSADGEEMWRHIIVHPQPDGKLGYNGLHNISEAPDGSIIVSGTLQRVYNGPRINDSWVMRLSPEGCLNESCDHVGRYWMFPDVATSTDDRTTSESLTLYPNPGTTWLRWMSPSSMTYPVRYSLTNLQGIQAETGYIQSPDAAQLNTDYLPAGMYILTMTDKSGRRYVGKWVKGN
jgi:hypothetical protein